MQMCPPPLAPFHEAWAESVMLIVAYARNVTMMAASLNPTPFQ
jgi:hypothetical protein